MCFTPETVYFFCFMSPNFLYPEMLRTTSFGSKIAGTASVIRVQVLDFESRTAGALILGSEERLIPTVIAYEPNISDGILSVFDQGN